VDIGEIEAAITRARSAITKHQAIKSCHSSIRKKADEAGQHVASLVDEVDQSLRELHNVLSRSE
jgi:hypothetical protein